MQNLLQSAVKVNSKTDAAARRMMRSQPRAFDATASVTPLPVADEGLAADASDAVELATAPKAAAGRGGELAGSSEAETETARMMLGERSAREDAAVDAAFAGTETAGWAVRRTRLSAARLQSSFGMSFRLAAADIVHASTQRWPPIVRANQDRASDDAGSDGLVRIWKVVSGFAQVDEEQRLSHALRELCFLLAAGRHCACVAEAYDDSRSEGDADAHWAYGPRMDLQGHMDRDPGVIIPLGNFEAGKQIYVPI